MSIANTLEVEFDYPCGANQVFWEPHDSYINTWNLIHSYV